MNSYIRVMDGMDWVGLYELIWDIMSCPEFPNLGLLDIGKLGRKLKYSPTMDFTWAHDSMLHWPIQTTSPLNLPVMAQNETR